MRHSILSFLLFMSTTALFAQKVSTITGDIVGDFESLTATITVTGIKKTQIKQTQAPTDLMNNLSISFPDFGDTSPIANDGNKNSPPANSNKYFYFVVDSVTVSDDNATISTQKAVFNLTIRVNLNVSPGQTFKDIPTTASAGTVTMKVRFVALNSSGSGYEDPSSSVSTSSELSQTLTKVFSSPNAAPTDFTIKATNKALILKWGTSSVDYVPASPAIKKQPDSVLVMVFGPNPDPIIPLSGRLANATKVGDSAGTCQFVGPGPKASCIECDGADANGFWIEPDTSKNANIVFSKLVANSGSFTVPNLQPDGEYTVVLQYAQGVKQTECLVGTPIINYSLTELNGGEGSKTGDPRCFIVSAAFGSPFNKHVDIFRWARDRFLEPYSLGHDFVEFYYDHSQPFADVVKSSPVLQKLVRIILYPIAFVLYALQESTENPFLSLSLAALVLSFAWFLLMRRRTSRS